MKKRLSRKASAKSTLSKSGGATALADGERQVYSFAANEPGWVSTKGDEAWRRCVVVNQSGILLTVRVEGRSKPELIDLRVRSVYPSNSTDRDVAADMTMLRHLNEPNILHNLEHRAYKEEYGTFIGPVLVSVNPLVERPGEMADSGKSSAARHPTPFAIAEFAFSQMSFAGDNRRKKKVNDFVNQTIISSGESGAGKTEASKKVLRHLVQRSAGGSDEIDKRLLMSNPITEAFGNAKTLRNNNSSRFGKLLKLEFQQVDTKRGTAAAFGISGASVVTYLLERSRVSNRPVGERNFHVFYYLLGGLDPAMRKALHFDKFNRVGFRYLVPLNSALQLDVSQEEMKAELIENDIDRFKELEQAMIDTGFKGMEVLSIFKAVAGVLHLGNVAFTDKSTPEGDVAQPVEVEAGYDPIECAASLFGVETAALERLLLERVVETRGEKIVVHRNVTAASFARDAVSKAIYSHVWAHVVGRINHSLGGGGGDGPFIGVLDIFGFESFARNDFEQLLINYTNESLQSVFNSKVFEAELALYAKEGLVLDGASMMPPTNEAAMELLAGKRKGEGHSREYKDAILVDLDLQSREMKPTDERMLAAFNQKFAGHPNFVTPHPKVRHEQFIVKHYAGIVAYTIGNFIEKNNDALPSEVNNLFSASKSKILAPAFQRVARSQQQQQGGRGGGGRAPSTQSIVKQFRSQIQDLLNMLESTACSFIRCVKPNVLNQRGEGHGWFNRKYVSHQLKHLSIPQTALVLRSGLPTRIPFDELVESYMGALPKEATAVALAKGAKKKVEDPKLFVSALFWAFQIDPAKFKTGHTKVFFRAGDIAVLDRILQQASIWAERASKDKAVAAERDLVAKRFRYYYSRLRWRHAYVKVRSEQAFVTLLQERRAAAVRIQSRVRQFVAHRKLAHKLESKRKRLAELERKRKEEEEERRRREEERKKMLEELERKKLAKLKQQATVRKQATLEKEKEMETVLIRQATMTRAATCDPVAIAAAVAKTKAVMPSPEEDHGEPDEEHSHGGPASVIADSGNSATESDVEDDSEESDTDLDTSKGAPGHLPHEAEKKRLNRYVADIERKARAAAAEEIAKRRKAGRKVEEGDEARIMAKIEESLMKETAQYEALRQHDEDLREDYFQQLKRATSVASSAASSAAKWLFGGPESAREVGRRLSSKLDTHSDYKETLKLMRNTSYVQERVQAATDKVAQSEEDAAGHNTLTRQTTMSGDKTYRLNEAELETPIMSAKNMLKNLHDAVETGEISADEFARMAADLARTLGRKSYSTHSEKSDEGFGGVPVACEQCRTENNTYFGLVCQSCNAPLPVDVWDQTDLFRKPDEEEWASTAALQFQGGKVFARVQEQINRYTSEFEEVKVFTIECAWQKRPTSKIHTRWVIKKTDYELAALHARLIREGTKTFKDPKHAPHEFPKITSEVRRIAARSGRYSKVRKALGRVSLRKLQPVNSAGTAKPKRDSEHAAKTPMSPQEAVAAVQAWLGTVFDAASEGNAFNTKPKGTNSALRGQLGSFLEVGEHVDQLLRTRGR